MTSDTCTAYVIPAVERNLLTSAKRAVYIVYEKDGTWYKTYEAIEIKSDLWQKN